MKQRKNLSRAAEEAQVAAQKEKDEDEEPETSSEESEEEDDEAMSSEDESEPEEMPKSTKLEKVCRSGLR
jgi:hypothetical protein